LLNVIASKQNNKHIPIETMGVKLFSTITVETSRITNQTGVIIVPFRDNAIQNRVAQLERFIPYIEEMFPNLDIIIVEQSDDGEKFNRGKLLNVGVELANSDYVILHDVDLLPDEVLKKYYNVFPEKPIHLGYAWKEYDYERYFGGIVSMSTEDYKKINGYPNNYWGWGGEDDEFLHRVEVNKLTILRPTEGSIEEMPHERPKDLRIPKEEKKELRKQDKTNWENNGINNLEYTLLETRAIGTATVYTIEIKN
jgi:predicted glycosyltransferase involved in capsule biosynthesis